MFVFFISVENMIKGELQSLLSRRGILFIILAAIVLNIFVVSQQANLINEWGYSLLDISVAYQALPSNDDQLSWINEKFETFAFSSFPEQMLYTELHRRVSAVVNYQENLLMRLEETEIMINSPFLVLPDTFGYRSLRILQQAYGRLAEKNLQPTTEPSLGIELATETQFTDIIIVFIALALALGIYMLPKEEYQYVLIKSTKNGRGKLFIVKFFVFLLLLFILTVFLYGINLLIGYIQLGSGSLVRPIQSLYGFSNSRFAIDIWQYLLLFILHKFIWLASIGCLLSCLCVILRNTVSACIAIIVALAANILAFQTSQHWIMMTNFIWISDTRGYFSGYYNLSFFGYPVDSFIIGLLVLCFVAFASFTLAFIHFIREENFVAKKSSKKWSIIPMHTILLFHEAYKLFVRQKGALVLIGFLSLQIYVSVSQNYFIDSFDRHYAQILAGPPSNESKAFLLEENIRFNEIFTTLEQYTQQLILGSISVQTHQLLTQPLNTQLLAEPAFRRAELQFARIKTLTYDSIAFVEVQVYEQAFGASARQTNLINATKLAAVIALGLSAIFFVERSTNMNALFSVSPKKNYVNKCKIICVGVFAIFSALIAYIPKILSLHINLGFFQLDAPLRSLPFMKNSFGGFSIFSYIIVVGVFWVFISCVGAAIAIYISIKAKSRPTSALAIFFTLFTIYMFVGLIAF